MFNGVSREAMDTEHSLLSTPQGFGSILKRANCVNKRVSGPGVSFTVTHKFRKKLMPSAASETTRRRARF